MDLTELKKEIRAKTTTLERLRELAGMDVLLSRAISKGKYTPATLLQELSHSVDMHTRAAVAKNPNTLIHTLEALARDRQWTVAKAVIENPSTPDSTLEFLAQHSRFSVRQAVAAYSGCPPQLLRQLLRDPDPKVRIDALRNPNSTAADCEIAALDAHEAVRAWITRDSRLCLTTRAKLAEDPEEVVRVSVASSRYTPDYLLEQLSQDSSSVVRSSVTANAHTPIAAVEALIDEIEQQHFEHLAWRDDLTPHILDRLGCSPDARFRSWAASVPITPHARLEILAREEDTSVLTALTRNPALNSSTLSQVLGHFSDDENLGWHAYTFPSHPQFKAIHVEIMHKSKSRWLRRQAAMHPLISLESLLKLSEDEDYEVKRCAAYNLKTPPEVLRRLALEEDTENSIRIAVAGNPNTPPDLLEEMAGPNEGWKWPDFIHQELAQNPSAHRRVFEILLERRVFAHGLLGNPSLPSDLGEAFKKMYEERQ